MSEELKGTNIYAPIVPGTDKDRYPTHFSLYGMGGIKCVRTLADRNSIPLERLEVPTLCYVFDEDFFYVWDGDQWKDKEMGGGGSGVQRNIRLVNNLDSKNVSASKGEPCLLNFTFISQERYSSKEQYENTGERGLCQISVRNNNSAEYVVQKQMYINSSTPIAVDVAEFLTSGANNVMIKVTGEVTGETTPAFVYTVQLTSLSIDAGNFKWWTAYTGDILLNLNVGGNVSKILYVTVTGKDYNASYEVPLGTGIYIETSYNYLITHPGKTGVFNISAYVANTDGSIKTKTVSFNVICAMSGEQTKLIAINNVLSKAVNWSENILFEYAMYDGDNVTASAQFIVQKDTMDVYTSNDDSITCSTKHIFSLPLEVETMDNSEFEIIAHVKDGETELTTPIVYAVDNSSGYSAVAGATFYMNPKTRSNNQANRQMIINEIDGSEIAATWEGVNWGNDCWTTDSEGNKALRLMAGSLLTLGRRPFESECARKGKTIEIDYRVDNVTDYTEPIITISSPSGDSFIGLNIYADDIIMHTQSLKNDSVQSLHTFEGKRTRLTMTVLPTAYGNPRFNLCILYINGRKNREFTYEDNDYFAHNGAIVIGSDYGDVDIYGIREYDSGLTSQGVLRNYINWLVSTSDKSEVSADNDILDSNGSEIDFDNTKDQFNVFVFDNTIPSMADQTQRIGTLEVMFYDHPEWNVSIDNVTAKGQGTSSMKYWIWNTRYQLDKKKSVITFANGTTSSAGAKWAMTPSLPAGRKFTAKKNYASSMHSHKIGAVNSYTDLIREVGILNEAMRADEKVRVSVWEAPFVCFEKMINDEGETVYIFRGLYTFGPDKGDANTFGYDTDLFPNMISIEGSDNSPLLTLFRVPWNPNKNYIVYNEDKEAWQYNGANSINFGAGKVENISKFIPAYNIVYLCSPRLKPFDGSLADLNARIADYKNEANEFWIAKQGDPDQYNVYYFEAAEGMFMPSDIGEGQINLVAQLVDKGYGLASADLTGKTNDELNTLFINARIAKFRLEAPLYWDVDDCLFFMNNVEFNAGTDERAKNTYPYTFGTDTSRWRWRVDDADTRFDTTNRGLPDKEYSVETHDVDETGASIWNGETNNFFNLMELAFPEEKIASMRKSMTAMQTLGSLKSGNDLEKLLAFYQKYFFNQAQEYFPSNAYNADAKYCYENGKLAYDEGRYSNDTDPITQSLGDHYLAEQRWITKRILYMMSKYSFGLFSANGTDTITVRAAGNTIKYELTPAMDMYPAIANGTSIIRGPRTKAGEVCVMEIELSGSGDQQNAIQGASYLQDIGDWHDKNVSGSMIIQGRMLRDIRLGSKTEPVLISISLLTLSNCASLQRLLLSNIASLSGTLNLANCTHLQEVHADGTSLTQMVLPTGGGLRMIEYSKFNQYLTLSNYPLLTTDGVGISLCKGVISDFFIVNCPKLFPMQLLTDIMDTQREQGDNHALKRIRAVGFEESYDNTVVLDKLVKLADGTYEGLSSEGLSGEDDLPVLDGTLNINTSAYEDTVETLRTTFAKLVINISGEYYIRFIDDLVKVICANNWGDNIGTSKRQMDEIIELGNVFAGTDIKSFNELSYTQIASLTNEFAGCTQLDTISLPNTIRKLDTAAFSGSRVALDLSSYTNITDLSIDSDDIISVMPDANSNLKTVTYNSGASKIKLVGYSNAMLKVNNPSEIVDFWVEDCNTNNTFLEYLRLICDTEGHKLRYVKVVGFEEEFNDNKVLKALQLLAEHDYHGINDNGERDDSIIPVLSGKLLCTASYSPDLLYDLQCYFPHIIFNMTGVAYIDFKDPVIKSICVNNWGSDRNLTVTQAAAVRSISTKFKQDKEITSFNEFKYFTGILDDKKKPGINAQAFYECTNLVEITLPDTCTNIGDRCFFGASSLESLVLPDSVTTMEGYICYGCTQLSKLVLSENLTLISSNAFNSCINLERVTIPASVKYIDFAFGNSGLKYVYMKSPVPPIVEPIKYSMNGDNLVAIYVPVGSLSDYQIATNWRSYSRIIKEYDFDANPDNVH